MSGLPTLSTQSWQADDDHGEAHDKCSCITEGMINAEEIMAAELETTTLEQLRTDDELFVADTGASHHSSKCSSGGTNVEIPIDRVMDIRVKPSRRASPWTFPDSSSTRMVHKVYMLL